jgi:16S rRNA G966 N2-methylase RsmD
LKALDYFFLPFRLKAKTKRHISFFDAINDSDRKKFLDTLVKRWKKNLPTDERRRLRAQYEVFQLYYGTINQFRPTIAKWLYYKLGVKQGVLDFSAGWGGRCLAAMSLGVPYIGIDANTRLESAYRKMINTYQADANVHMIFQPSETVDFSKYHYDLIFTSPPYFMLEKYEKMPQYETKQDFLDKFFLPVVKKAWASLKAGGKMALNIPEEMYLAIRSILPPIQSKIVLKLSDRHSVNAAQRAKIGETGEAYGEFIYVWHKKTTKTRRKKRRM